MCARVKYFYKNTNKRDFPVKNIYFWNIFHTNNKSEGSISKRNLSWILKVFFLEKVCHMLLNIFIIRMFLRIVRREKKTITFFNVNDEHNKIFQHVLKISNVLSTFNIKVHRPLLTKKEYDCFYFLYFN